MPQIVKRNGKFIKQFEMVEETPDGDVTHYSYEYQGARYATLEQVDAVMDGTLLAPQKKVLKKKTPGKTTMIRKDWGGSE